MTEKGTMATGRTLELHEIRVARQKAVFEDLKNADLFDKDALKKVCLKNNVTQAYLYLYPEIRQEVFDRKKRAEQIVFDEYNAGGIIQRDLGKKYNMTEVTVRSILKRHDIGEEMRYKQAGRRWGSYKKGDKVVSAAAITPVTITKSAGKIPAEFYRMNGNLNWASFLGFDKDMSFGDLITTGTIMDAQHLQDIVEAKCKEYSLNEKAQDHVWHNASSIWYTMSARLAKHGKAIKVKTIHPKRVKWRGPGGKRIRWGPFLGYNKDQTVKTLYLNGEIKDKKDFMNKVIAKCDEYGLNRTKKMLHRAESVYDVSVSQIVKDKTKLVMDMQNDPNPQFDTNNKYMYPEVEAKKEPIMTNEELSLREWEEVEMRKEAEISKFRVEGDESKLIRIQENIAMANSKMVPVKDALKRIKEILDL